MSKQTIFQGLPTLLKIPLWELVPLPHRSGGTLGGYASKTRCT